MEKTRRKVVRKKIKKAKSFEDKHYRLTTYLERSVRQKMVLLKEEGLISSYKGLVNKAIKHYIKEHL